MYFPTLPKSMRKLFDHLAEKLPPHTTFIDIGCGKGITLLLAARYPFEKIIGVEFCREFAETAKRNIARYRGSRRSNRFEVLCMDAVDYEFPDGPLLIYFFNPFRKPVLERVLENIAAAARRNSNSISVVCDQLHDEQLFQQALGPGSVDRIPGFVIYSQLRAQPVGVKQPQKADLEATPPGLRTA